MPLQNQNKICVLSFLFAVLFFPGLHAHASTDVNHLQLATDTTWTAEGSPYLVHDYVQVPTGVTLTIEPGVQIVGDGSVSSDVSVFGGTLVATGTSLLPVELDGIGMTVYESGKASLKDVHIKNAFVALDVFNQGSLSADGLTIKSSFAGINVTHNGSAMITNSLITEMGQYGSGLLITTGASALVRNVTIEDVSSGVGVIEHGSLDADHLILRNIEDTGIFTSNYAGITDDAGNVLTYDKNVIKLHNSEITDTGVGITIDTALENDSYTFDPVDLDVSNNSFHQNGQGVWYGGGLPLPFANNWWGDEAGPLSDASGSLSLGDKVSSGVTVSPWLTADPLLPVSDSQSDSEQTSNDTSNSETDSTTQQNQETKSTDDEQSQTDTTTTTTTTTTEEAPPARTPVLIIPGIMGTEISEQADGGLQKLWLDPVHNLTDIGDQFMDDLGFTSDLVPVRPHLVVGDVIAKKTFDIGLGKIQLFDYGDGLTQEFKNQGYTEGTDLFVFPYDWRYGVSRNVVADLKNKIESILATTRASKVDIVAHSMGGLLVKKYVMEHPGNNHIGKAIFVGVPNTGAPKAVKILLQGDSFGNPFLASSEIRKIAANMPAVYDLLPSRKYFAEKGSFVKIVDQHYFTSESRQLDFGQTQSFLANDHGLNSLALSQAQDLHGDDFDNFDMRSAGLDLYSIDGCKTGTIGKLTEVRAKDLFGNSLVSYNAPEEVPGDGTVPLESSTNLPIDGDHKYYALSADHSKMLSQDGIRQEIVNTLSASSLPTKSLLTQDISRCKLNGKAIAIYSPLSIDVTDADGNHSGLSSDGTSIENTIPNADFEVFGDHKFVYLPEDENQKYTVMVAGTDTGVFTLTDAKIENNVVTQTQVFEHIPVTQALSGTLELNDTPKLSLDTDGNNTTDQVLKPSITLDEEGSKTFDPQAPTSGSGVSEENTQQNDIAQQQETTNYTSSSAIVANGVPLVPAIALPSLPKIALLEQPAPLPVLATISSSQKEKASGRRMPVNTNRQNDKKTLQVEAPVETVQLAASAHDSRLPVRRRIVIVGFAGLAGIIIIRKKIINQK